MLQIDLWRLRQRRSLPVNASISPDAEMWAGTELAFSGPVRIEAAASLTAEGGVVVRGSWRAEVDYECGRCLDEAKVPVERGFALSYLAAGEHWDAADPDVRIVGRGDAVLDLGEAIREEVVLEVPRHHLPVEKEGRCTRCGRRVGRFGHVDEVAAGGVDPRWAALEALRAQDAGHE